MAAKQLHTNREMKSNKKDENNHKPPSAYFNAQTIRLTRCRQSQHSRMDVAARQGRAQET